MLEGGMAPGQLFTTAQLGRMLGISPRRLRSWVRAGLVHPAKTVGRIDYFDFQQVASARTLHRLIAAGATPARIRKSLEQIRPWLPDANHALAQLEMLEHGGPVLIRLEDGRLADPGGQLRLDFEGAADLRVPPPPAHPMEPRARSAADWFEAGLLAEREGQLEEATRAYHRALLAGGPEAEIAFNLGNALYALDRKGEAVQRFMQAVEIDAHFAAAWNNLGNALADLGRFDEAVEAYESALRAEPRYADAHFNLAETLHQQGEKADARRHYQAYLAADPDSAWAERARQQIRPRAGSCHPDSR